MIPPRFLFDEHLKHDLVEALRIAHPGIDIVCVGDSGAPPKGTPDEVLLEVAEGEKRAFVTMDKRTMPDHLARHFGRGRHTW